MLIIPSPVRLSGDGDQKDDSQQCSNVLPVYVYTNSNPTEETNHLSLNVDLGVKIKWISSSVSSLLHNTHNLSAMLSLRNLPVSMRKGSTPNLS